MKRKIVRVQVLREDGTEDWITLEEFAKLFMPMTVTDGRTYSRSVLVPVQQGGEEP